MRWGYFGVGDRDSGEESRVVFISICNFTGIFVIFFINQTDDETFHI